MKLGYIICEKWKVVDNFVFIKFIRDRKVDYFFNVLCK